MDVKKILVYVFAGKEYEGGFGVGIFEVLLNCIEQKSLNPLREYKSLIRGGIIGEKIAEESNKRGVLRELYELELL